MSSDPGRASACWRKAEAHLQEAVAQDPEASPMAMVRSSYYAMFHAARAVLFLATGSDGIALVFGRIEHPAGRLQRFVQIPHDQAEALDRSVVCLGSERIEAAADFLATCDARYGFRSASPAAKR